MAAVVYQRDDEIDLMAAALSYARNGMYVVPLLPRSKIPWLPAWPKNCSTDAGTIAKWWHDKPDSNIGIVAGKSDLVIVDVDPRNGGMDSLNQYLLSQTPELEKFPTVQTGGDGLHFYLPQPNGTRIGDSKPFPGIDIKGATQIVAPPSLHPNGNRYKWLREIAFPLQPFPDSLLQLLTKPDKAKRTKPSRKRIDLTNDFIRESARNDILTIYAGSLRYEGFPVGTAVTILKAIRDKHCENPQTLPDAEIESIVQSIWNRSPRIDLNRYVKWWQDFNLQPREMHFLVNVASDQCHGIPFPSMKRLEAVTGMSEDTIYRARRALESKGIITVTPGAIYPEERPARIDLTEPPFLSTLKNRDIIKSGSGCGGDRSNSSDVESNRPKANVVRLFSRPRKRRSNRRKPNDLDSLPATG